jgi:hypothetical protein
MLPLSTHLFSHWSIPLKISPINGTLNISVADPDPVPFLPLELG